MLARQPGQAVTAPLLKELDQLIVPAGCLVEELGPSRTGLIEGCYARHFRDAVFAPAFA